MVANSIAARTASRLHFIPFLENERFVGRNKTLHTLENMFFEQKSRKVALWGLGGMGKTQVALHFAHWAKQNKPDYSVFWVSALSAAAFEQAYMEMARTLPIQKTSEDDDPKDLVRYYLNSEAAGPWLLIVDNADNLDVLFGNSNTPGGIYDYLPVSDRGQILFTTRYREVAVNVQSDLMELHEMNPDEAKSLLKRSLTERNSIDDTEAMKLLDKLTYLPLAITQAAAYLKINQVSIAEYLRLLRSTETEMIKLLSREFRDGTGSSKAVATTWVVSFDQIGKSNSTAANLLSFISHIEPKAIPLSILPPAESEEEMLHAIGTLRGYTFLVKRGNNDVFDMHSLVHLAIRTWLARQGFAAQTEEKAICHIAEVFPSDDYENRSLYREFLPHALRVLQQSETSNMKDKCELHYWVGCCLRAEGRIKEAVMNLENCCRWRECFPEDYPERLASQYDLARAYRANGQVEEAIKLLENVVKIRKEKLATVHPSRLASQHELIMAYQIDKQAEGSSKLLEWLIKIEETKLAGDYPSQLASQHELAGAYLANGQVEEAIKLLEYIVEIREVRLAKDHPSRLASQHELTGAYLANGQVEEAIKLLEWVVKIQETRLAENHPNRLASQHALTGAYNAITSNLYGK